MRDRNTFSRYEYKEDRFDFNVWVRAPGPTAERYWSFLPDKDFLTLKLEEHGQRMGCNIPRQAIFDYRWDWRKLIAMRVRQIRYELRHK